jgi:hypothetical protein
MSEDIEHLEKNHKLLSSMLIENAVTLETLKHLLIKNGIIDIDEFEELEKKKQKEVIEAMG